MDEKPINFWKAVGILLTIFIIGVTILAVASIIVRKLDSKYKKSDEVHIITKVPECTDSFTEYQALINKKQSIQLIKNVRMYASDGKLVNGRKITLERSGAGEIACGYLYVKARKNGHQLEEQFESFYINPNKFGGHLIRRNEINIPQPEENTTEILLPLDAVAFTGSPYKPDPQKYQISDWVKLLNVSNQVVFSIGLSANDSRAKVDEIRIAYKCWNPDTGKETNKCNLSIK